MHLYVHTYVRYAFKRGIDDIERYCEVEYTTLLTGTKIEFCFRKTQRYSQNKNNANLFCSDFRSLTVLFIVHSVGSFIKQIENKEQLT